MKKIFGIIAVASAFLASCSSPYYPEYVPTVSLGANTSALVCENVEGTSSLNVISNMNYTATIISGSEWLSFAETDGLVYNGWGNTVLKFNHLANNHDKRVARVVLAAESRRDTIKIKQRGQFEDYLDIHPDDVAEQFTLESGTRMSAPEAGGLYTIRLRTSCLDHQLRCWTDRPDAVVDMKVENKVLTFRLKENIDAQPRIISFDLFYVDGWDDERNVRGDLNKHLTIKQQFDPLN